MVKGLRTITPLLCTLLLAVFPVLSLFAHNQSEIEVSVLWWPLAWSLIGAGVIYGVLLLFTRRAAKAGVLASPVVIGFFYCGLFSEQGPSLQFVTIWLFAVLVAFILVLRSGRDLLPVTIILGAGAAAMTLVQVAGIVAYNVRNEAPSATDARLWPSPLEQPVVQPDVKPPDIYVLMPDDYARPDILAKYFDYNDSAFVAKLEKRGFVLPTDTRSPYSYSEMNMASMLNLDYLSRFPFVLGPKSMDMRPVKRVLEDNRAARALVKVGYDYVHIDTDEVTYAGRNPDISPVASPDSFMSLWLQRSALRPFGGPFGFNDAANNARFRDSVRNGFAELARIRQGQRPKFVVFHTLIPHDPYLFGANGQAVTFPADADHTGKVGMDYYVHQLEFVNTKLLESIDTIIANSPTPPVILIQADEGFEVNEDLFGTAATQDIRVKGLSAFRLPGAGPNDVPSPPTMVNNLRFIFNRYLGTHYPMLESVSYPELDLLYQFKEIPVR